MKYLLLLMAGLMCSAPTNEIPDDEQPDNKPPVQVPIEWQLVWADEFDGAGLPDPAKWTYEYGMIRNNERQFYTRDRAENARVENGSLVLEARKENYQNAAYTSASITTRGKKDIKYGRIEVKAKIPTGRGMWPAIWMLGTNINQVGWPKCGEIDIMENVGFDPDKIHFNIHTEAFNHVKGTNKGATISVTRPWEDYHVYAVEWFPSHMDFYYDDQKAFTFYNSLNGTAEWPFDQPHYLILNIAVGGAWGGLNGIDDSIFPQKMHIDYVRVYEQKK